MNGKWLDFLIAFPMITDLKNFSLNFDCSNFMLTVGRKPNPRFNKILVLSDAKVSQQSTNMYIMVRKTKQGV